MLQHKQKFPMLSLYFEINFLLLKKKWKWIPRINCSMTASLVFISNSDVVQLRCLALTHCFKKMRFNLLKTKKIFCELRWHFTSRIVIWLATWIITESIYFKYTNSFLTPANYPLSHFPKICKNREGSFFSQQL